MRVRCLHCHEPTDVAGDSDLSVIICTSCGSHFSLFVKQTLAFPEKAGGREEPELRKLGHFELIRQLGAGGFGDVWLARDTKLDRIVAVKIPRCRTLSREETEQFFREARAAAQLQHPNIVSVHEVGREGDTAYIVSDFISGSTLKERMSKGRMTAREAADLCAKMAGALHHAHEAKVIHRDLKPSNVMIDPEGQPHLMDFGLARREAGEVTMTLDGQVLGTPAYMSPEQARGQSHQADRKSDVYALGVILFELLTGELPFRGNPSMLLNQILNDEPPSPRHLNHHVPRDLETICLKCLHKNPERRYPTAETLAADLRRWLAGEPIQARPVRALERVVRWCKRKPWAAAALALLVFSLLSTSAGLVVIAVLRHQERQSLRQSFFHQARALRQSTDPERRSNALAALEQASAIRPSFELREEYLRCLELVELRPAEELLVRPKWQPHLGDFAAMTSEDKVLIVNSTRPPHLIDSSSAELLREFAALGTLAGPALLSPDGRFLAASRTDGKGTQVWNLTSERLLGDLKDAQGRPIKATSLAFSGDSKQLAVASHSRKDRFDMFIFNVNALELKDSWSLEAAELDCLCFGPDSGALFASTKCREGSSHVIKLWFLTRRDEKTTLLVDRSAHWTSGFRPRRLALKGDGRTFVTGGASGTVKGWDIAQLHAGSGPSLGREILSFRAHEGQVLAAQFSPDGRWLATAGQDSWLRLWDAESLTLAAQAPLDTDNAPNLQWSPSGGFILCDTAQGLRRWEVTRAISRRFEVGKGSVVSALLFSPQERWLACIPDQSQVALIDLASPDKGIRYLPVAGAGPVAFSLDDQRMGLGLSNGYEIWQLLPVKFLDRKPAEDRYYLALAFNSARQLIGAGLERRLHLKVWNLHTEEELLALGLMPENRMDMTLPDGRIVQQVLPLPMHLIPSHLALLDRHKEGQFVRVFDLTGRQQTFTAGLPFASPQLALADGGRWLAVPDLNRIGLYDVENCQQVATLAGHDSDVQAVAFDGLGDRLASVASGDGTARLWNVASGEQLAVFHSGQRKLTHVALSPSGRWLATGAADGQVRLWDLRDVRRRLKSAQLDWAESP